MIQLIKLSFGSDTLTTINFQVRNLDLQAMGGDEDSTGENFGPMPFIRPSKGLEIMRCSNKVPKRVTHSITRGLTDSSCYSI